MAVKKVLYTGIEKTLYCQEDEHVYQKFIFVFIENRLSVEYTNASSNVPRT